MMDHSATPIVSGEFDLDVTFVASGMQFNGRSTDDNCSSGNTTSDACTTC